MLDALKPRLGKAHHRGDAVLRLCAAGPQSGAAGADQRQAGRRPDHHRGRVARADHGSARRADPGIFQYPGRQPFRHAGAAHGSARAAAQTDRSRWSRPTPGGVERARAFAKRLDAALAIIDKRRARGRTRSPKCTSSATCEGRLRDPRRRHRRHGRHLGYRRGSAARGRRHRGDRVLHAPSTLRARRSSDSRVDADQPGRDRHHPAAPRRARTATRSMCSRWLALLAEAIRRTHHEESISSLFV